MKSTLARLRSGWKLTEDGCQYVGTLDFTFAYIYDVSSRLACHFNRVGVNVAVPSICENVAKEGKGG